MMTICRRGHVLRYKRQWITGAIQGDEDGCLGLSYKDLRAIVREYRCGLYNK